MVPEQERTEGVEAGRDGPVLETDGAGPGFDEAALYVVVRDAVKDALLDVIGTLLLVGIAFVLVLAGGQALFASAAQYGGAPVGTVVGVGLIVAGLYIAAATLEVVPPIREWF